MVPFVRTKSGLTVFRDGGSPLTVHENHVNFQKIYDGVLNDTITSAEVETLLDEQKTMSVWSQGKIKYDGEQVTYDGFPLHSSLARRLHALYEAQESFEVMEKFIENLYQNPSLNSVEQLYGFLSKNDLPITPDGQFLAYKKVRYDYKDLKSGTFDNSIGSVPSMPRHQVDDDKNVTCSRGLHVASFSYMQHYGSSGTTDQDDVIMICKVNPKDVVSVPVDYDNAKMRVASYEVVGEIPRGEDDPLFTGFMTNATVARLGELIKEFRALDQFKNVKFNDEFGDTETEKELEDMVLDVFYTFNVDSVGKSTEDLAREFLDEFFYSFTMKDLIEYVANHS